MNSSLWRLEGVDGGDEQYPVESRFAVRHTPSDEQDPRFDRSAQKQVRFLRFALRHTPPNQQDPVSTVGARTQVCFLRFAVRQTPPDQQDPVLTVAVEQKAVSIVLRYARHHFGYSVQVGWLPMNRAHSVAS